MRFGRGGFVPFATLSLISVATNWGCNPLAPLCLAQQKRGRVATIEERIEPGERAYHRLTYETKGSQNDVALSWSGHTSADGPRIQVYVTRAACLDLVPGPPTRDAGPCAVLDRGGWVEGVAVRQLIITHGRGNPETLGSPPEYKLWVLGDAAQRAFYRLDVTWFYGPDC